MPGAYKRGAERAKKDGRYTCWWKGADGKRKYCPGTSNLQDSRRLAQEKQILERRIMLGLDDPAERQRMAEASRPIAEHVEDYRAHLAAKGDDPKHVANTASALARIFESARVEFAGDITPDRIQGAIGRMRAKGPDGKPARSARTCNHALRAVKSFARWLADTGRLRDYPAGLRAVEPIPVESDRRRVRRPLSVEELARLIEATAAGPDVVASRAGASRWSKVTATLSGECRAMAYRVAMATGFRANEVRTLTPERFRLDGPDPAIVVLAGHSKRGKRSGRDDVQPITRAMADAIRPYLAGKPAGVPLFPLPPDRTAQILAADLARAGIPAEDEKGRVVDFHALRHSYVTNLIRAGKNPKVVQKLARHSDVNLTLGLYTSLDDSELRRALEDDAAPAQHGEKPDNPR